MNDAHPAARGQTESHAAPCDDRDPYCLDGVERQFDDAHHLSAEEIRWLLVECRRLLRAARSADARVFELERELNEKDRDYTGLVLEWQDLADEHTRLEQELAVCRLSLSAKRGEIDELRQRLEQTGADNVPTVLDDGSRETE